MRVRRAADGASSVTIVNHTRRARCSARKYQFSLFPIGLYGSPQPTTSENTACMMQTRRCSITPIYPQLFVGHMALYSTSARQTHHDRCCLHSVLPQRHNAKHKLAKIIRAVEPVSFSAAQCALIYPGAQETGPKSYPPPLDFWSENGGTWIFPCRNLCATDSRSNPNS